MRSSRRSPDVRTAAVTPWVLGVDSGGSGLRVALAKASGNGRPDTGHAATTASREPVRTGPAGIDAAHLLDQLLPMARALLDSAGDLDAGDWDAEDRDAEDRHGGSTPPVTIGAVAIGAAGMATLGDDLRARLPGALESALGVRRLALAADAVTAYAGALGLRPGAVVAAGTGMIALGTDLSRWRRADGWGHLLGDCGSGAWIGRAGLEAAMRAHDGRSGGSRALLARVEAVFGPAPELPGLLYPRTDRPAVLASFAPEVARCAAAEPADPVAARILREAAGHIADAAAAVCPPSGECEVALTGGLFKMGDPLLVPLRDALTERLPHARTVPAAGDPLAGAVRVAASLATDGLRLPVDGRLLHVPTEQGS
ncbi:N-acetylglucosamine kinase [Streptomyces flavidovirens]|uniref:N-acetylglucosamine kinase n=1 Tax=Streptomyces flavidovirens TaxID=67298 RepID=UPI0036827E43